MSDVYQRRENQAHDKNLIGVKVNFYLFTKADFEQSCFEDACTNEAWMQAMQEEMDSINRNDAWELKDIPHDKKNI